MVLRAGLESRRLISENTDLERPSGHSYQMSLLPNVLKVSDSHSVAYISSPGAQPTKPAVFIAPAEIPVM